MGELFRFPTALREVPSVTTHDAGHPQSNAYGFPPVQDVPVPIVDVSGDALRGFSVWIGNTRAKSFSTLTNASRFASELRVMLKGGEL